MPRTDTVIIGAGHAGLAVSRCLTDRHVRHVVLDRGRVGERWRTARWDSFRLLTPNWLSRLPGWSYAGSEPDGFMSAVDFVDYLSVYARSFDAPVRPNTLVTRVARAGHGFAVHTDGGAWAARRVVVATGYHSRATVPDLAVALASGVAQTTPSSYRSPSRLPDGGVLVVGGSASGVQIAHELARAGRQVVLAVGGHSRLPRRYRGQDILWSLDRIGALDRTIDQLPAAAPARPEPSLQLAGASDARRLDLGVLEESGVRLAGRLRAVDGPPPVIPVPTTPSTMDLNRIGVTGVVWAPGLRPWYPWLAVPVLDGNHRIRHHRGITDVPGLYAVGLRFQHRRSSTFIDGVRHDAAFIADHITANRALRAAA